MAFPTEQHNTYEEVPDLVKAFVNEAPDQTGQRPRSKVSRDTLVRTHQRHLKLLSQGSVPIRSLILPKPYPPARGSVHTTSTKTVSTNALSHMYFTNIKLGPPWRFTNRQQRPRCDSPTSYHYGSLRLVIHSHCRRGREWGCC
jgi:hypothetical protein